MMQTMTFDDWVEKYAPIRNDNSNSIVKIDDDLDFTDLEFSVRSDLDAVNAAETDCVWTLLQCDGELYVVSGIHFVNREAYLITSVAESGDVEVEL